MAKNKATKTKVFNQAFGQSWALYHGDCVRVLRGLLDQSIHFSVYSPPFANLYIYSTSIADMGNSSDSIEFMDHYRFLLKEMSRVLVPHAKIAVHIKDLPLFLNRDDAMGLLDLPGFTIQAHEENNMTLVGWYTIWKDPVIEMQRTKNSGLLWSEAFCKRAERARQGMADYVLLFELGATAPVHSHTPLVPSVIERCMDLWMNLGERLIAPHDTEGEGQAGLWIVDQPQSALTDEWIQTELLPNLMDGRNLVCHICDPRDMQILIARMLPYRMVFHSRVALTDGTWLVVFRKWLDDMMPDTHVTHDLKADEHIFVGNDGPQWWDDDRGYSIQVWQRYASPVWYDLDGLPTEHEAIWMDIDQTDVLNFKLSKESEDEKHICPLQLGVIERCILKWSRRGNVVLSPFGGVGSEGVVAIKKSRKAVLVELKDSYYGWAKRYLEEAEFQEAQPFLPMFDEIMEMAV